MVSVPGWPGIPERVLDQLTKMTIGLHRDGLNWISLKVGEPRTVAGLVGDSVEAGHSAYCARYDAVKEAFYPAPGRRPSPAQTRLLASISS